MPKPDELHESAASYAVPGEAAPEPWSHPWHDQLDLLRRAAARPNASEPPRT